MRNGRRILLPVLLAGLVACRELAGPLPSTVLVAVTPAGGATGVDPAGPIALQWSHAMQGGMERFVALHQGGVAGPTVPLTCIWSGDRVTLTCTPTTALAPGTQYTVHVGGGMRDALGGSIDMGPGMSMGGEWATGGMMGAGMMATSMMGTGWRHGDGTYGMVFSFTTA